MKAISIRQPFAHLVAAGIKNVEDCPWRTGYRGPLLVLALKQAPTLEDILQAEQLCKTIGYVLPDTYDVGGIVGIAYLADCVPSSASLWYDEENYALTLTHARPVPFTPYHAIQKIFDVEGYDHLWHESPPQAPRQRTVIKPPPSWFHNFQQRVDRLFEMQQSRQ